MSNDIGGDTSSGDRSRAEAAKLRAMAALETNRTTRVEYERPARSYLRLAEQADRNGRTDISDETPPYLGQHPKLA